MSRDSSLFLDDIRTFGARVLEYAAGMTREELFKDKKTYDAVMHNLILIGEAVKNIPDTVRAQYPQVEWRNIGRFRDFSVHHYFGLDHDVVWNTVTNKIAPLLAALAPPDTL